MNNLKLRKAILAAMGLAALSAVSTQAQAFGGESYNIGTFTGTSINSTGHASPFKSWTDYGAANQRLGSYLWLGYTTDWLCG
jgi:hypothetical protein